MVTDNLILVLDPTMAKDSNLLQKYCRGYQIKIKSDAAIYMHKNENYDLICRQLTFNKFEFDKNTFGL